MANVAISPSLKWAGLLLGFSLGGFFDGILLHQVLQWHHLLSNVDGVGDLRVQLLADGLFHVLMYALALAGLVLLWKSRTRPAGPGGSRALAGLALLGFGTWHVLDSVLSHWVLGIHRIKGDSPQPLFWDLLWFVVFGLVPLVLGRGLLRRPGGGDAQRAAAVLGLAALVAGPLAALPAGDGSDAMVMFAPGVPAHQAFDALARADARVLWGDGSGGVWAVKLRDAGQASRLYREGALLVSNSVAALGCFSFSRAPTTSAPRT
jgi:uncharacterized membrane protein